MNWNNYFIKFEKKRKEKSLEKIYGSTDSWCKSFQHITIAIFDKYKTDKNSFEFLLIPKRIINEERAL